MRGLQSISQRWNQLSAPKRWQRMMSVGALVFALVSGFLLVVDAPAPLRWAVVVVWALWIVTTAAVSTRAHRKARQQ
jgi:hypothetical protein